MVGIIFLDSIISLVHYYFRKRTYIHKYIHTCIHTYNLTYIIHILYSHLSYAIYNASAKYVTGGGMKTATANRVHVLHKEGNMPYRHRGSTNAQTKKKKKNKKKNDFEDEDEDDGQEDFEEVDDDVRAKVSHYLCVCVYVC